MEGISKLVTPTLKICHKKMKSDNPHRFRCSVHVEESIHKKSGRLSGLKY